MLDQGTADQLMQAEKRKVSEDVWGFPDMGGSVQIPVISSDGAERFIFDLSRGRIQLSKVTYQERYLIDPLVRLDVNGPDHMNPDGEIIPCPHLHTYREGYGTRVAQLCPLNIFTNLGNIRMTLDQFFKYCNVVEPPTVNVGVL